MIDKKNKFHKIVVVAGGWSNEREISLLSGKNVYFCLRKNKFNVKFFNLKKNNIEKILLYKPDIIFNSLHGEYGEDGGLNSLANKIDLFISKIQKKVKDKHKIVLEKELRIIDW